MRWMEWGGGRLCEAHIAYSVRTGTKWNPLKYTMFGRNWLWVDILLDFANFQLGAARAHPVYRAPFTYMAREKIANHMKSENLMVYCKLYGECSTADNSESKKIDEETRKSPNDRLCAIERVYVMLVQFAYLSCNVQWKTHVIYQIFWNFFAASISQFLSRLLRTLILHVALIAFAHYVFLPFLYLEFWFNC